LSPADTRQPGEAAPVVKEAEPSKSQEKNKGQEDRPDQAPSSPWRRRLLVSGGILAAILILGGGVGWWLRSRHWVSTDDAFIDAHVTRLAPRIAGQVVQLLVRDNQVVQGGDLLLEIDPADFQVRLNTARARRGSAAAQVAQLRAEVLVRQAAIGQAEANVVVAEAEQANAEATLRRFQSVDPRAVTQQQRDDSDAQARSARAKVEANRQAVAAARAQVASAEAQVSAAEAAMHEAEATVKDAELQLSYTRILAPVAGRVTNRSVEVGNYVNPGQALLALVEPDMWVTANFKETQLSGIRPGQAVEIRVDAYPEPRLNGVVDSIQSGTGARFSALPAENATGNYVKITQRVPVKILIQDDRARDMPLAPGLSVVPYVRRR
jgi:membrane fusion protein (multidrug efflux system)